MKKVVAGIMNKNRILPDGDLFGNKSEDEFIAELNGERFGVFKRFEYLSIPFSIVGREDVFYRVLKRARENSSSFKEELKKDAEASNLAKKVLDTMSQKPEFSKQVVDTLLSRVYVHDNLIARMYAGKESFFEDNIARIVVAWNKLADFYNIEGFVGGNGENNPFEANGRGHSVLAGGLDSLEARLPQAFKRIENDFEKKKMLLQLSSIVGRSYKQIEHAINVLDIVSKDKQIELNKDEVNECKELVDILSKAVFSKNIEHGKFFNTIIRFHNWMPLALKKSDPIGDAYDSICVPSKKAFGELTELPKIKESLSKITDATSPKGLGIATLVDEGKIPGKEIIAKRINSLENEVNKFINNEIRDFFFLNLKDNLFYSSITGGKWRGLKLLSDAKEALGLKYNIPEGFVMTSFATQELLKNVGADKIIYRNALAFSLADALAVQNKIMGSDSIIDSISGLESEINSLFESSDDEIVVRSSMYGEDGNSNFSGTYESKVARNNKQEVENAIKAVVSSYFSKEAISSRNDVNLAHIPGIGVIFQRKIAGKGGVIHITNQSASISYAKNPEEAVQGNGVGYSAQNIDELLENHKTELSELKEELKKLHQLFGDIDLEFVVDKKNDVYLTQMRTKYTIPQADIPDTKKLDKLKIKKLDELLGLKLDRSLIVEMDFLGKENLADKESLIMDFIRNNKQYIKAVAGYMPQVAHIPNKIEGHFRIPYIKKEYLERKE
jgi:hypothetical protein